ncbi:MAG: DUF6868 family protein [Candidatus Omnitrophota bacterium]
MNIQVLQKFFMWCTIINGLLFVLSVTFCTFAGNWVYRMHSKMFHLSRESFNITIYSFLGLFKVLFLFFNAVPYIVLLILK